MRTFNSQRPDQVTPTIGSGIHPFRVSAFAKEKKIFVLPGFVAMTADGEDKVIRPIVPTIDEIPLDADERPSFDYSEFEEGEHEIVCTLGGDKAEIQVLKDGEVVAGAPEGELPPGEEEEPEESFLLATVTFETQGSELVPTEIKQFWESDIAWPMPVESSSSSSGDESSDQSSGGGGGGGSGSEKSTAIVPASWTPDGYAALFAMESPDVRFTDILRCSLNCRVTRLKLDPRFVEVCEPGSIVAVGLVPERPMQLGARVDGGFVIITRPIFSRPCPTVVHVSGIRKGFAGMRFPSKTSADFEANERFLQSARPPKP